MNIIYPTFGHNHLAEWLLIVIPIAWWYAIYSEKKLYYFFPILFTVGLWFSFGRIAIVLGFIQLLVILCYYKKNRQLLPSVKKILLSVLILYVIGFIAYFVFSIVSKNQIIPICQNTHYSRFICKNTDLDTRKFYFQQAIEGWKRSGLVGYGLGTFKYISVANLKLPGFQSNYAHSNPLNILAETGVVGFTSYYILFGYLLSRATKIALKRKLQIFNIILISAYFSYVNSLFDFSWSYKSIIVLTTLLLSMIIGSEKQLITNKLSMVSYKVLETIHIFLWILLSFIVISYGSLMFYSRIVRGDFQYNSNFFVPYFYVLRDGYVDSEILKGVGERKKIYDYYKADHEVIRKLVNSSESSEEQNFYQEQLYKLYPWHLVGQDTIDYLLSMNDLDSAANNMKQILEMVDQKQINFGYFLNIDTRNQLAQKSIRVADYLYSNNSNYSLAGNLYVYGNSLSPWVVFDHYPDFSSKGNEEEKIVFFQSVSKIDKQYFGDGLFEYQKALLDILVVLLKEKQYIQIPTIIDTSVKLFDNNSNADNRLLWEVFYTEVSQLYAFYKGDENMDSESYFIFIDMLVRIINKNAQDIKQSLTYDQVRSLVSGLQSASNQALSTNHEGLALRIVDSMNQLLGEDYWVAAQKGHLFSLLGDKAKAIEAYEECMTKSGNENNDCSVGKDDVINGYFNSNRFYQVSQIIMGEKRWQDFQ
ncbi:O-antigen ligase family protein [Candidatus Dojkabacteria bacterium]|nr:O-antigen ligase family protein [Candidatus Dojkabacteria bacterium]